MICIMWAESKHYTEIRMLSCWYAPIEANLYITVCPYGRAVRSVLTVVPSLPLSHITGCPSLFHAFQPAVSHHEFSFRLVFRALTVLLVIHSFITFMLQNKNQKLEQPSHCPAMTACSGHPFIHSFIYSFIHFSIHT